MPPRVAFVLGTRPEIVKLSPVVHAAGGRFDPVLVHTGQHYSYEMDRVFFEELELPEPAHALGVGSGSHGAQTGAMLAGCERVFAGERPAAVVVQGDTNTALAGALAAAKMHLPVVHVEAGCRSGNRAMAEEINRVLVGRCADLHLAPHEEAVANLVAEGTPRAWIHLVGSTAVDACRLHAPRALVRRAPLLARLGVTGEYAAATIHRAENTVPGVLEGIMEALAELSLELPVVLPLHPRTRQAGAGPRPGAPALHVIEPLGYLDALALFGGARLVVSDSGGVQEDAPALGVPVVVARNDTEWGDLIGPTGNVLAGNAPAGILAAARAVLARRPPLVDLPLLAARAGAAERIVEAMGGLLAARAAA